MKSIFKKELIAFILNFFCFSVLAQPQVDIHPLSIGQQCPDFEFDNLVRFPRPTAHLSDFKDKLVILDFWATWCGSCLYVIPELDALQQKYSDQIFILPVSFEKKEIVENFLKKKNAFSRSHFPSVTNDSVLSQYFKHNAIPHDVWINGEGKVIAITGSEDVNDSNIVKALSGKPVHFPLKQDIFGDDIDKPLLIGGLGNDYQFDEHNLICSSILTGNIPGISTGVATQVMKEGDKIKLIAQDCTLNDIFNMALNAIYRTNMKVPDTNAYASMRSRMILEVKDSSYFIHCVPGSKKIYVPPSEKLFCYEIIRPLADSIKISSYALKDVNEYFGNLLGIEAVKEKRWVPCWVLTRLKTGAIPYSKGGKEDITIDPDDNLISLHNIDIDYFISVLMNKTLLNSAIPMINETGILQPLDFEIKADLTDPISIGKALHKYGLDIVLEDRGLEMNIIRDKK